MTHGFDIFSCLSFPVIVTDANGVIIYKNLTETCNLMGIRRGMHTTPRVVIPEPGIVYYEFDSFYIYKRALASERTVDGSTFTVYAFIESLQFEKSEESLKRLLRKLGSDAFEFYISALNIDDIPFSERRIEFDMMTLIKKYSDNLIEKKATRDVFSLCKRIAEALSGTGRPRGMRILYTEDGDTPSENTPFRHMSSVRTCDLIFLIGRMICAVRSVSEKGDILFDASDIGKAVRISVSSKTDKDIDENNFKKLSPEFSLDAELITGLKNIKSRFSLYKKDGMIFMTFTVPYISGSTAHLSDELKQPISGNPKPFDICISCIIEYCNNLNKTGGAKIETF